MSDKAKQSFLASNPERLMIFLFPLITLGLFLGAAVLWWLINTYGVPQVL
jgi:hypothetical protein